MKKTGLVGGMGPESTVAYYRDIVFGVNSRVEKPFFPEVIVESLDVFHVQQLIREEKYEELTAYLLNAVKNLARGGADFAVLTANTAHVVFDRLRELSPLPLVSIVEATYRETLRRGLRKVGLLGTVFTMTRDFYKQPFVSAGVEVIVPAPEEMEYINDRISRELEFGIVKEDTLTEFQRIISRMRDENGIEAVILGCTELPLLLNDNNSPVPCLDTVKIHVDEIINILMND